MYTNRHHDKLDHQTEPTTIRKDIRPSPTLRTLSYARSTTTSANPNSPVERSLAVTMVGQNGTIYMQSRRNPQTPPAHSPSLSSCPSPIDRQASPKWATNPAWSMPFYAAHGLSRNDTDVPSLSSQSLTVSSASSQGGSIDGRQGFLPGKPISTPPIPRSHPDDSPTLLQVPIPSHRLGVPEFSNRGTLFFQDSLKAESWWNESTLPTIHPALPHHDSVPALPTAKSEPVLNPHLKPEQTTAPRYEDTTQIKYSTDGKIVAVIPEELVAQITHVDFLDYNLLSDFFLTYRSYVDPSTLLRCLIARLEWAMSNVDPTGPVVRVRTFVAIRHWILNYFLDDFEPDYSLRVLFCEQVNSLAQKLAKQGSSASGDIKVVTDLKKCWKNSCKAIWASTDRHDEDETSDIIPGGTGPSDDREPNTSRPPFTQQGISNIDSFRLATTPVPWSAHSNVSDVTPCSIPMWKILGRSIPSFRPRALGTDSQAGSPMLENNGFSGHQRSKTSSESIQPGTPGKLMDSPILETPLASSNSGLLIRGMLIAPVLPAFTTITRPAAGPIKQSQDVEKDGRLHNLVGHMKQKLGHRDGSPTRKAQHSRSSSRHWKKHLAKDLTADLGMATRSDRLAADVAETYGTLLREETQARINVVPEPVKDTSAMSVKEPQPIVNQNLMPARSLIKRRQSSHVTCSSQSIMIINDTNMDFDLSNMVIPPEYNSFFTKLPGAQANSKILQQPKQPEEEFQLNATKFSWARTRRNSTGSVFERRPSRATEHLVSPTASRKPSEAPYGGYLAMVQGRKESINPLSLIGTHPYYRLSYQAEMEGVARLATYDTIDGGGGRDFALAKLEGRVQTPRSAPNMSPDQSPLLQPTIYSPPTTITTKSTPKVRSIADPAVFNTVGLDIAYQGLGLIPLPRPSVYEKDGLGLGLSQESKSQQKTETEPLKDESSVASKPVARPVSNAQSFLLDEDESLSDRENRRSDSKCASRTPAGSTKSKASAKPKQNLDDGESYFIDRHTGGSTSGYTTPGWTPASSLPPSTPLPALPQSQSANSLGFLANVSPNQSLGSQTPKYQASPYIGALGTVIEGHTPFILGYRSEAIAAQLTIIERDALSEIDWKELVETRWSDSSPEILNWAEYMRVPDQTGVDIVTARFNLAVKWAVSEILLATTAEVRAATITKLIHIASHARHLRNFATAYQLTTALLSSAVTRLTQTWALVPAAERSSLASLERLVSPTRNFAALRAETDQALACPGGGAGLSAMRQAGACIPFLGIYTHDLAGIAQRPARVTNDGVEMVNFERFAAAASAVKGLLGLLEASGRYALVADRELVARCLWLAALGDEEIEARSRELAE